MPRSSSSKPGLHRWMIRLVSLAVPGPHRAEWRREWEAELTALERAGPDGPAPVAGRSLFRHSLGAWPDALSFQRRRLEDELAQDVKYAVRALLHAPIFCLTTILSLAIGIGAATAVFAVANAALLQPLPYPDADRLVLVGTDRGRYLSVPVFTQIDRRDAALELVAASESRELVLSSGEFPELIRGHRVTADMPALLGLETTALRPVRGRPLAPYDFDETSDAVALLSHRCWVNRFHSSDDVVGRIVVLDSIPTRIVGVLPPAVGLFGESELLLPWRRDGAAASDESQRTLEVFGRLAAGVDVAAAQHRLNGLFQSLRPVERARVERLRDRTTHAYRSTLASLWLVTMGVLLVCCLNFASLLATRTSGRRDELAVRVALGATRTRLIRQLLTEAVLVSLAAGACGVLLARLGRDALVTTLTIPGTRAIDVPFDWVVVAFAAVLSAAIGIRFSLRSARRATAAGDIVGTVRREPSAREAPGRRTAGWLAGAVQVAVTMALLASVGILVQSVLRVQAFDSGYDLEDVVMVRYDLPLTRYGTGAQIADFANQLLDGIRLRVPGGARAAASTSMPVGSLAVQLRPFSLEVEPPYPLGPPEALPPGWPAPPPPPPASGAPDVSQPSIHQALSTDVSPGYFSALGVPVVAGREFSAADLASAEPVVVVNEAMARRYWADRSPIGQRIRIGIRPPWLTVVGVVGDVRRFAQDDRPRSEFYRPLAQIPQGVSGLGMWRQRTQSIYVAIKTETPLAQLAASLGPIVVALDEALPARRMARLEDELDAGMQQRRAVLRLFLVLAAIALFVAVSGVYGVTAYIVRQQLPSLGIRSALGASGGDLIWLVMRANLTFLAAGMLAGVILAGAVTPQLQRLVPDVTRGDWSIVGAIGVLLSGVLTFATYVAARQGSRVDPLQVLRRT